MPVIKMDKQGNDGKDGQNDEQGAVLYLFHFLNIIFIHPFHSQISPVLPSEKPEPYDQKDR